jgi:hypothetical protein
MYYSFPCPYCSKVYYTFNDSKETAASTLYNGIKQHLTEYGEDDKEHQLDDGPSADTDEIYNALAESNEPPAGGYAL